MPRRRQFISTKGTSAAALRVLSLLRDGDSPIMSELAVLELLAALDRDARRSGGTPAWLVQVRDRLREVGPLSLGELANFSGVHPTHVVRSFRAHYGISMSEFVRRQRVEQARRLLLHGDAPLASVAVESGFFDQSHMTRDVRRVLRTTPGALRRTALAR